MQPIYRVRSDRSVEGTSRQLRIMNVLNGGAPTVAVERSYLEGAITDVCHDVVIPNFAARSARGEIFNNPFSHLTVKMRGGGGSFYAKSNTVNSIYYNDGPGSVTRYCLESSNADVNPRSYIEHIEEIQELYNQVLLQAVNKIDSTNTSVVEDLLELRKTIDMMSNPISTIYDLSRKYRTAVIKLYNFRRSAKRGKGTGEKDMANALATTWLTARFGFAQPVLTLMTLHQAYLQRDRDSPTRRRVGAGDSVSFDHSRTVSNSNGVGGTFRVTDKCSQSYNSWYLYTAKSPFTDSISGMLGLRLKDVPKGIWQVMPSSWVVDRFIDVSSFIGAGMKLADPTIKILSSGYTYKGESTHGIQCVGYNYPGFKYSVSGDEIGSESVSLQRIPGTPTFTDFLPVVKNPLKGKSLQSNLDLLSFAVANLTGTHTRVY